MKYYLLLLVVLLIFGSCEKEIVIELPGSETQIVVQGKIEPGMPPMVILTKSIPYYTQLNEQTLGEMFVREATVRMVFGNDTIVLERFCLSDIPDSLRDQFGEVFNLPAGFDQFCIFTSTNPQSFGKINQSYTLLVNADGKELNANTTIPTPIPLDSLWFKPDGTLDSLGFLYARLADPPNSGNAYRWFAQRINKYTTGNDSGRIKDLDFVAPFNSAFDDEFFNGTTFDFAYNRGVSPGSHHDDDLNIERGYFKVGDTVLVKFSTIDEGVYKYYRSFYNAVASSGSPFSSPANVKSNVNGGLGIWAGYGTAIDTLIVTKPKP